MRFSGLTILAAAFACALGPLSALASPVDRRSLPPDHPALLEPLKASAAGLAPRASVIPHDLLESHLADPFKSSTAQRKRLVARQEEAHLAEPFKADVTPVTVRALSSESTPDETTLNNPFKTPDYSRKRALDAPEPAFDLSKCLVELVYVVLAAEPDTRRIRIGHPAISSSFDVEPWAEKKPDLTAVVGH